MNTFSVIAGHFTGFNESVNQQCDGHLKLDLIYYLVAQISRMRGNILLLTTFYSKTFSGELTEGIQEHAAREPPHSTSQVTHTVSLSVYVEHTCFS